MKSNIRAIIVDDEPSAIRTLKAMLKDTEEIRLIAECKNGKEAIAKINALKPEMIFLDIQMPVIDGFEVLEHLSVNPPPVVIFVTAYDRYAIRAFEAHALDYLLKPYNHARLLKAVDHACSVLRNPPPQEKELLIGTFVESPTKEQKYLQRILVKHGGRIVVFNTQDIDWVEAAGDYVKLNIRGEKYLMYHTLANLEDKLNPLLFVRIHRSSIVNISRIKELVPMFNRYYQVVLRDGQKLTLSRNFVDRTFKVLNAPS